MFYIGVLYGQRSADLQRLSFETRSLINEVKSGRVVSDELRPSNHQSIRENLERYANYMGGEYPLYSSNFYDIDNIKKSFIGAIFYASNEISRSPRSKSIDYWNNIIVTEPEIADFARLRIRTTNRYYDLLESQTIGSSPP